MTLARHIGAAILAAVYDANGIRAASARSMIVLAICLAPQLMHLVAWDTSRIWTYSILCAFFVLLAAANLFPYTRAASPAIPLLCLFALILNGAAVTPLMDGLRDHFDLTTRLLLYAPVVCTAVVLSR